MESYEVLERAIPRKQSERVAKLLGVTATYIRQWRREPESDDEPQASGRRSILDRICDLIDAVFLVNPKGVGLIVEYINNHYHSLMDTHAQIIDCHRMRHEATAELLTESTEAVNKLNLEGCTNDTLQELIELRDAADRKIKDVQKTLKTQEGD